MGLSASEVEGSEVRKGCKYLLVEKAIDFLRVDGSLTETRARAQSQSQRRLLPLPETLTLTPSFLALHAHIKQGSPPRRSGSGGSSNTRLIALSALVQVCERAPRVLLSFLELGRPPNSFFPSFHRLLILTSSKLDGAHPAQRQEPRPGRLARRCHHPRPDYHWR